MNQTHLCPVFLYQGLSRQRRPNDKALPDREHARDHFTKSLRGGLFHKFRAEVQGIPTDLSNVELGWDREEKNEGIERGSTDPSPQECVGKDTTSVPEAAGPSRRYGKSDLIPLDKILGPPPATSTSLCTCDVGANVPIGGRSYAHVFMKTR
jgi:hypothetical protein